MMIGFDLLEIVFAVEADKAFLVYFENIRNIDFDLHSEI
jgi:hypothetical protein